MLPAASVLEEEGSARARATHLGNQYHLGYQARVRVQVQGIEHCSLTCLFLSQVTITTIGYGDIHPMTLSCQIIVIFIIAIGVVSVSGAYFEARNQ